MRYRSLAGRALLVFAMFTGCAAQASSSAPIPAPIRIPAGPYYYGVLAHPWTIGPKLRRVGNMNIEDTAQDDYVERLLESWQRMGVRYVRIDYTGNSIEDRFGRIDFRSEDETADRLLRHGMIELPVCLQYGAARWSDPRQKLWATPQDFAGFCGAVAAHLRERYPQFTRIELMNEPNQTYWWFAQPGSPYAATDGSAAATYLRAAYAAVKRANPRLTIVAPALGNGGRHHINIFQYFVNLYAAGCRAGACWDVLSVHNYAWTDPGIPEPATKEGQWAVYKGLQTIAVEHGDPKPHVMLTEAGFCHGSSRECQSPQVQALYMARAFNLALADPTVDGITWQNGAHPERDDPFSSINCETDDLKPYPCFYVFRRFSLGTDRNG